MPSINYMDWDEIERALRENFTNQEIDKLHDKWCDSGDVSNGAYMAFYGLNSKIEKAVKEILDEEKATHIHFSW